MDDYPKTFEAFYEKGRKYAQAGFPKLSREQFKNEGYNKDGYRGFIRGYEEAWEAMSPSERQAAALRPR